MYDHLPASIAVHLAWAILGPAPMVHRAAKNQVRKTMPVLARALDRLALEQDAT